MCNAVSDTDVGRERRVALVGIVRRRARTKPRATTLRSPECCRRDGGAARAYAPVGERWRRLVKEDKHWCGSRHEGRGLGSTDSRFPSANWDSEAVRRRASER